MALHVKSEFGLISVLEKTLAALSPSSLGSGCSLTCCTLSLSVTACISQRFSATLQQFPADQRQYLRAICCVSLLSVFSSGDLQLGAGCQRVGGLVKASERRSLEASRGTYCLRHMLLLSLIT